MADWGYGGRRDRWREGGSIFTDDDERDRGRGRDTERSFLERAGDEVRSWFGDEEAERRRERDTRRSEVRSGFGGPSRWDEYYRHWRDRQIARFDRDYEEYCRERQERFGRDFDSWRGSRLTEGGMDLRSGGSATGAGDERASAARASTGSSPAAEPTAPAGGETTGVRRGRGARARTADQS